LIHLLNEEDIHYLLKAFYYWEELNPSFTAKYPTNLEEYKLMKDKQKDQEKKSPINSPAQTQ